MKPLTPRACSHAAAGSTTPVPGDPGWVGHGRSTFALGDRVRKKSGSEWEGHVVGYYSTTLTPIGVAVESAAHRGSVQIYPEQALEKV